jgi:hypothetical protein
MFVRIVVPLDGCGFLAERAARRRRSKAAGNKSRAASF